MDVTFINEGIIPQNFSWRAGIGTDTAKVQQPAQQPTNNIYNNQEELYDGGIKLTRDKIVPKYPYGNVDLTEQLIPEIDTQVTTILERYKGKVLDTRLLMEVKDELKKTCLGIKSKYRMYMNEGFYNKLYNQCKLAFERNFVNLKEGTNAMTEFIEVNGELYGNPLLIYGFFQM